MSRKVLLRNVRLSYEHIFTPTAFDESQAAKYSATFILPKDHPDLAALKSALYQEGREKYPQAFAQGAAWPAGFTCSLKDADAETNSMGELLSEKNPAYRGCYIVEANSTRRPVVLDRRKSALSEADGVIYSGCYVNASLGIAPYEYGKIKKGVKCYLNGVQFVADGERFGTDAADDFEALDGADDDSWL